MTIASDVAAGAELLRVLGHPVRLTLLSAIIDGERPVGEIETLTGIAQPMLSQQLGVMRKSRLVDTRREAKQIFYRINHERIRDARALIDSFVGASAFTPAEAKTDRFKQGGSAAMFARVG